MHGADHCQHWATLRRIAVTVVMLAITMTWNFYPKRLLWICDSDCDDD